MALNITSLVIKDVLTDKETVIERQVASPIARQQQKPTVDSIKEPSVVVNGKVKKIGKKSAFLLDMLSLDD